MVSIISSLDIAIYVAVSCELILSNYWIKCLIPSVLFLEMEFMM